jgi:uncharacterized protein (DUF885 family)
LRSSWLVVALLCALVITSPAQTQSPFAQRLHRIFEAEWNYDMEQDPPSASELGDRRWNTRWEDVSISAIHQRQQHYVALLEELKGFDRAQLSPADQLNYDLFRKKYEQRVQWYRFHLYLMPVNQMDGIQSINQLADALPFQSLKDYQDWIARLQAFPAYMDQTIQLMRKGMRETMMLPKVIMSRVLPQIDSQIVSDPAQSPFYEPFKDFPKSFSSEEREQLQKKAQDAIRANIVPSFQKFREFYEREYLPACFDQVGIWQVPHGDQIYAYLVRRSTTTDLTPEQIHQIGLKEVERIHGEMLEVMQQVGFKGSLQDFFKFLRTDPQFYYKDPKDLFEAYQALAKSVDPKLVNLFRVLPRMPYGVEPIPAETAPTQTTAYYRQGAADGSRAGTYFVNLYRPETRPKWEMTALTLHEAVPGHHLQITLAMELGDLPKFRRYGSYTAFVEGWGLYAESLGEDINMYRDPYAKFGELTYDMWRAVRLVVDTGMHSMHWDRQRAINFFMENAPKTELDITNEIDRYIVWPGQALAYKIGQLKIKQLRARAVEELGPAFDLKEFHNVVLGSGPVPLDVLDQQVEAWIASRRPRMAIR